MDQTNTNFKSILIKLASPEKILSWSRGEVTKPETINYRSQRPERDGLFCEKIFGPEKDYECYCGKYRKIRYKGIICDKCGVEITKSIVRRERMGHISLAAPVAHIWFLRSIPSRIGLLLGLSINDLERVIYYSGYIITKIDEEKRETLLKNLEKEFKRKIKNAADKSETAKIKEVADKTRKELKSLALYQVLNEIEYHRFSLKYGEIFEAGIGAEALYYIFKNLNLENIKNEMAVKLQEEFDNQQKIKILGKFNLVSSLLVSNIKPEWMFLKVVPVIPPALRPIVPLDGGRHATSDVNDLYRRVINRNNRLKKLMELRAPEVMLRNEKRMLQESVDALMDNSLRHTQELSSQRRPLKSLADMLKGKQGRFRQNLLGKRVDYSGRSVIVVGSELKIDQVGLPKHLVLELFRPFVIAELLKEEIAFNIKGANKLIDEPTPKIWAILEDIIKDKYVLLNRAPTLHRLGIQAFKPILIEGHAIQIHPLVCEAFNADFDGDQMAVHIPLTQEAQEEAKRLMASSANLLKPGTGEPIVMPSQDIIAGCYWLTKMKPGAKGEGKFFASPNEAVTAYEFGVVALQSKVNIKTANTSKYASMSDTPNRIIETTVGRVLFNSVLPSDFNFINTDINKKTLNKIVANIIEKYDKTISSSILDKIKDFGFRYATLSGVSWGMNDLKIPEEKKELIKLSKEEALRVKEDYEKGLLNEEERYNKNIKIWMELKNKIFDLVLKTLDEFGPVNLMVSSAARGKWDQVVQMTGMTGLVNNPAGKIIELPIFSSYKEGLNPLEYFISTHGARKGTADTALKTSAAGYLTRRLVDVASDIILENDCGAKEGIIADKKKAAEYSKHFSSRIFGRTLLRDVKDKKGKIIFQAGHLLNRAEAEEIEKNQDIENITIRSPLTCATLGGLCQTCYGFDLGNNALVKLGETVGVVAAQSIGEPGTQLTMRTFHTGGVAGAGLDITFGLPRVEELFEIRIPSNPAVLSEVDGKILEIKDEGKDKKVTVLIDKTAEKKLDAKPAKSKKSAKDEKDAKEFLVPFGRTLIVKEGDYVQCGDAFSDGPLDVKKLYSLAGKKKAEEYILKEVAKVYFLQGVSVNAKHIEVIIRQMFSRFKIKHPNDTDFFQEKVVEQAELLEKNNQAIKSGLKPAEATQLLMGITKVALTTSSVLSAASFQDTTRVLVSAALHAKKDRLKGLKENVIIGRLIPAGTTFRKEFKK